MVQQQHLILPPYILMLQWFFVMLLVSYCLTLTMKQKKIANFNSNQKLKILSPRYPLLSEKELYLTHVDNLTDSLSNFSRLKISSDVLCFGTKLLIV